MNESPDQPDKPSKAQPEVSISTCTSLTQVGHVPVLAEQVLDYLSPQPGEVMVDATLGRGGHALLLAPRLGSQGRYVGLDVDPVNLAFAQQRLTGSNCRVECKHANFQQVRAVLDELGIARVNLFLADLGFSSNQMDDPSRGFSFQHDGPLDMRLDPNLPTTAADLVNQLPERELADLIYQYGEERLSRRIARNIVENRRRSPMLLTSQLAELVRRCYGPAGRHSRIDPATRTFMALRIAVNGELEALESLLKSLPSILAPGARAGIISFHSLEDRLVKHAWQTWQREGRAKLLTKKPLTATEDECRTNPRSRSAKMRVLTWQGTGKAASVM